MLILAALPCVLSACSTRTGLLIPVDAGTGDAGDAAHAADQPRIDRDGGDVARAVDAVPEVFAAETGGTQDAEPAVVWPHGIQAFDATLTNEGVRGSVDVLAEYGNIKALPVAKVQPFTLVFDPDARLVYVRYAAYPVTSTDGRTFRVQGPIELRTTPDEVAIRHTGLLFTIDGGMVAGSAHDEATTWIDQEHSATVDLGSSTLTGGPDVTPPQVWWSWSGEVDPFFAFGLYTSEALVGSSVARLIGSMGDVVTFAPYYANTGGGAVGIWETPKRVLRYGATYRLDSTTMRDFAGHELAPFEIKTQPLPPLVATDGFESAPLGPFAGGEVISSSSMTPLAGSKSLFVKASCTTPSQITWTIPRAVFRVPVVPTAKVLSISYRVVSSVQPMRVYTSAYVGVEGGGEALTWSLNETGGTTGIQTTRPTLPAGTKTEAILVVTPTISGCPAPAGPDGVLIDDVHTE